MRVLSCSPSYLSFTLPGRGVYSGGNRTPLCERVVHLGPSVCSMSHHLNSSSSSSPPSPSSSLAFALPFLFLLEAASLASTDSSFFTRFFAGLTSPSVLALVVFLDLRGTSESESSCFALFLLVLAFGGLAAPFFSAFLPSAFFLPFFTGSSSSSALKSESAFFAFLFFFAMGSLSSESLSLPFWPDELVDARFFDFAGFPLALLVPALAT